MTFTHSSYTEYFTTQTVLVQPTINLITLLFHFAAPSKTDKRQSPCPYFENSAAAKTSSPTPFCPISPLQSQSAGPLHGHF